MADFARVLLAVDEATGSSGYATYTEQASRTAETVAEGDSVCIAIVEQITSPWEGSASDLLKLLAVDRPPRDWPSTPQGMGGRLTRAAPTLRAMGWTVEKLPRTRKAKLWHMVPTEEHPAGSAQSAQSAQPAADLHVSDADAGAGPVPSAHLDRPDADTDHPDGTDVSAGDAVSAVSAESAGYSSVCRVCGQPLLLQLPGRDICARCEREVAS